MGKIIRISLSLVITIAAAYCIADYPYGRLTLILFALLYGAALFMNRRLWLFIVPALIPVSDMTLYSGRLFLSEIDILLMVTLAILLYPRRRPPGHKSRAVKFQLAELAIGLMALSYLISAAINLSYPTGVDANDFSSYQSPLNTFRVAKGFFWAMVFWFPLRHSYRRRPERTQKYFINGILTGLFLAGLGILWERGVMDDVFHMHGLYQIIGSLLDFSTTYRITGFFSAMHVGGTAIDGYLIMAIPFCLYGFFAHKTTPYQMSCMACLMIGSYGIMVTFSRGLYGGFLAVILFMVVIMSHCYVTAGPGRFKKLAAFVTAFILLSSCLIFLFIYGGYGATIGGVFLILATAFAVLFFRKIPLALSLAILLLILLMGSFVVFDSLSDSKWSRNGPLFSALLALIIGLAFTGLTYFLGKMLMPHGDSLNNRLKKVTIFSLAACIFWLGVMPPLLNVRVSTRFSTIEEDFAHRAENWRKTLAFGEKGLLHDIFGTGVGSFPRYYFFNNYGQEMQVHYRYGQESDTSFLSVGHGDFSITQKIPDFKPNQPYLLRGKSRSQDDKYLISLKICPKHILYSERYTPNCISNVISGTGDNQWKSFEILFNSADIGQSGIFNWPITLLIYNARKNTVSAITDIELLDSRGENLLSNGAFQQKSDRWIMIRDFSHDAWHAKNIFVHMVFEQGYFGLLAFLFLTCAALSNQITALKRQDPLAPVLIAAITGTLVVGLFGTIIDNPRVATLYFLLIFFGLLKPPTQKQHNQQVHNE